jgi:1A family penicillin-binding protein
MSLKQTKRVWHNNVFLLGVIFTSLTLGLILIWFSTLSLPEFSTLYERRVAQSTKIYDRTGKTLLYSVYKNKQRTVVPTEAIGVPVRNATIAIEDSDFYEHRGVTIKSIIRAFFANLRSGERTQGGSTITQQVIKNSLLSTEKTYTRKIKEAILAIKLERVMSKEDILTLYLNENPYGGSIYGIEEASLSYFGKPAADLTLAESAYLAALPQAPSRYSPYGDNIDLLEERKNLVLNRMAELNFINEAERDAAKKETVLFLPPKNQGLAPHFVAYVRAILEGTYGADAIETEGLKVITTLDADLQVKAEKVVYEYATRNGENFNAKNAALVALDPRTGEILTMVGSRDFFDLENEGNFNVVTAKRQPGSAFKPFVYATLFKKGYTPETVFFDVPTQFSTSCGPYEKGDNCYNPGNFDDKFRGPMTIREALAQSINIPAVKALYLAGINDSIETARDMGITTLTNTARYGLTLVLGGGEVTLLELTNAYGVFAQDGNLTPYESIVRIEDKDGKIIYESQPDTRSVLDPNIARQINSILTDNQARIPTFGTNSPLMFPGREVAAKTGTTDGYRDFWIVGYTPNLVVGAWAGNNDQNDQVAQKIAGLVVAPLWRAFMDQALPKFPNEDFSKPEIGDRSVLKPVMRGIWLGGETIATDRRNGQPATNETPPEEKEEKLVQGVHSILYWVDKQNPLGDKPSNPDNDPQFKLWEPPIRDWANSRGLIDGLVSNVTN